jgi:hypothetical protein
LKIIFDRFQQLDEPQSSGTKGFGLGLSIVKQLALMNLGKVEVQSEPGKGSTFSFTLPTFDPQRILACHLESVRAIEGAGDLWMLHIRSRDEALDVQMLRRLVSSLCYPMDLVLQDADGRTVNALGVSSDAGAWANRLRAALARLDLSGGQKKVGELEIKTEGPWLRDADVATLSDTLLGCLGAGSCHV